MPRKKIEEKPLSKFKLILKSEEYPDWMYDEHYQTPTGIAIHPDCATTYPMKLNAKQKAEVEKVVAKLGS